MTENRTLYRYAIYRIDPAWRRLPDEERAIHKKELVDALTALPDVAIHPYSLVGLRADADLLLWEIADDARALQYAQAQMNATSLGRWLAPEQSYLAMTRKSQYLKGHTHDGQEHTETPGPAGKSFLFVYPMDKQRSWYRVPLEERRAMMIEHFKIGHKYPNVKIHTGYSFGIDDQEFVVAFEGDSLGEFLDLVEELRGSEASAYTARDVPIYAAVRKPIEKVLNDLDGV